MNSHVEQAVTTIDELFDDCDVAVNNETEETVTLSVQLTSDRLATLATTISQTPFSIQTVTYRGASNPSTITFTTEKQEENPSFNTIRDSVEGAYRGETEDGHSFTFFGTNNRVEIHDFFNRILASDYTVTEIKATETPPLCIDVTVES